MAGGERFVTYEERLSQITVAMSISDSPDMASLGLGQEHLSDAMAEVVRHLLALGARIAYGGDLRAGGFSSILFELVSRYKRDADLGDTRIGVTNYLAWPVHVSISNEDLKRQAESLSGIASLALLDLEGIRMSINDHQTVSKQALSEDDWKTGLTSMRRTVQDECDARIVLGGQTHRFKGRMPGIAEEVLIALEAKQPVYVLGGFGGCAADIASDLGLLGKNRNSTVAWAGRERFVPYDQSAFRNGLEEPETETLASTAYIDEALVLILRGLFRLFQSKGSAGQVTV
jgi:hypothetical protein